MNDIEQLKAKITTHEERKQILISELSNLGYEAEQLQDPKAIKKLASVRAELADWEYRAIVLKGALAEAIRLQDHADAEAREQQRQFDAVRVEELGKVIVERCKAMDEHAFNLFEEADALHDLLVEMHKLGAVPHGNLTKVAMQGALKTHSMGTRLQLEHIAPNQRHTFTELGERWISVVKKVEAA